MKKILISTKNDRGSEVRASTSKDHLCLSVFYQDTTGQIRKSELTFLLAGNYLQVVVPNTQGKENLITEGKPAEKLGYKR